MKERANKLGWLFLSLSYGGNLVIDPLCIESMSDFSETPKGKKTFRSISSQLNERGWLVLETHEEIFSQIEAIKRCGNEDE